ncbi:MAG TPA: DHA2 family efflux MFS transporter permease subunit [Steroidobacteraceae bacterium]|nr:DHA2 family efflux MFS transporter permease subunit [Steroidobacteraceae bacterium]
MSFLHPACDSASAQCAKASPAGAHPNLVLTTTILASALAFVDGSVVNVALPTLAKSFNADASALQWVINSYLLPLSALLLLGGAAGDYFGRRRLLILGTSVFALASLGSALAPGLPALFASRLFQGIGAAMLMPNSLAILGQTFSGASKGRAIGIWAATGAAAAAIGPVVGGWLIDLGSWRAIFLLNLPLACGAIILAWRVVPHDRRSQTYPLDAIGGILATTGLAALTWALTVGSSPRGWTPSAVTTAAAAVLLLCIFLRFEFVRGPRAMMPLHLFASKSFVGLTIFTLLLYGALGGLLVLLPFVLIKAAGYSATGAGAALLPLPLILTVTSPLAGALAGRIGTRAPLAIGPLVVAAGFLIALRIDSGASYWTQVLPMIVVIAFGMSGAVAPLTTAVLTSVDPVHTGSASGLNSAVARTGSLIATALLGSVLAAEGDRLLVAYHVAMGIGALICVAASLSAFTLLDGNTQMQSKSASDKK